MTRSESLFIAVFLLFAIVAPDLSLANAPDPIADPAAVKGGKISIFAGPQPKSFNYYLDNNTTSAEIFGAMFESLLSTNPVDLEYEPGLAKAWSISDDKKSFTFHIDPRAAWSDGKPVTARDVRFTWDTIMKPANLTGPHKLEMERFYPPVVKDEYTVVFRAKEVHWKNLGAAGGMLVLPEHAFSGRDFNRINFSFPVVSGPYRLGRYEEGRFVDLVRRSDWWAADKPKNRHIANFDILRLKFFAERENAFEAFKKGAIDLFPVYTSRLWIKAASGEKFSKNWIVKQKIYNKNPVGFQGFAMNMRRPPFNDVNVRKAMALLLDREKMNRVLMYNQYFLHRSYYEDIYDREHPCTNRLTPFDKKAARSLLEKAGWRANPATGILEKDGRPFVFKFLTRSAGADKFLAIYAEDLKDVGIVMEIDKKDWAAWARDMDEFNFQMTWAAWSAGVFKDPEGMWSSSEANRRGSSNITGFSDKRVDDLIKEQKKIFEVKKRNKILRKIDSIIFNRFPYVLLWNIDYVRLLYWNRFGTPKTVLSRYGDERSAYWYWWADPDAQAELEDAMAEGFSLPPKESTIRFDEVFHP